MPTLEQIPLKAWQEFLAKIPAGSRVLSWLVHLDGFIRNLDERDPFTFSNGGRALQSNPSTTYIEESDVTSDELAHLEGVTSAIQGQLDAKPDLSDNNTWTGTNRYENIVTIATNVKLLIRDAAIGLYSQADTFLDLFADGAVRIGNSAAGAPTTLVSFEPGGDTYWTGEGSGLPFGGIYVEGVDVAIALAAQDTYYQVTAWSNGGAGATCEANLTTPDASNDHITVTKAGKYLVLFHVSTYSAQKNEYEFEVSVNNGASGFPCTESYRTTSVGGAVGAASGQGLCNLEIGDTVELWVERKDGAAVSKTITFRQATLTILQVGGT